ncbi:MAG TPA: response regulator [Gammaproteobacteria bacterium]|jgi:CheY-like chemotaxis protein|nr:response regulator [Gammaproteobacteria bacterium]
MIIEKEEELIAKTKMISMKVLVADDDVPTRMLLRAAIQQWGYEVSEAGDGEEAWKILNQEDPPPLLVVDWLMPKLDGIGLCKRIKEELNYNPYIILLTQVTGTSNIVKALNAGADEFLTKPFNMAELQSRLQVGAKIVGFKNTLRERNQELEKYISRMESLAEERARELVLHSDFIMVLSKLALQISQEISDCLSKIDFHHNQKDNNKEKMYQTRIYELHNNLKQVSNLIQSLQKHSIKYSGKATLSQVNEILKEVLDICRIPLSHIKIDYALEKDLPEILIDREEVEQAFLGLIINMCEFLKDEKDGTLKIETTSIKNKKVILVMIESSGPKIANDELGKIFQPYWGFDAGENANVKMSVSMSRNIFQKFQGTLRIETCPQGGIKFIVDLPVK